MSARNLPSNHSLEIIDLDANHMYRHESEVQSQLKGGYLKGKIKLPKLKDFILEITAIPTSRRINDKHLDFVPNLLFLAKKKKTRSKKRKRRSDSANEEDDLNTSKNSTPIFTLEDEPWKIVLRKKGSAIFQMVNNVEKSPVECLLEEDSSHYLELGNDKLMLSILTPLQKPSNKGYIDIITMVHQILQRDPERLQGWSVQEIQDIFIKKKSVSLNEAQLRFVVKNVSNGETICTVDSPPIKNTKHKSTVPIQVEDAWCAGVACIERESRLLISLTNSCTSDLNAKFVLMTQSGEVIMNELINDLNPITNKDVKQGFLIDIVLPIQKSKTMMKIFNASYKVAIMLTRNSDNNTYTRPVQVPYQLHSQDHCCSCSMPEYNFLNTKNNIPKNISVVPSSRSFIGSPDSGISSPPFNRGQPSPFHEEQSPPPENEENFMANGAVSERENEFNTPLLGIESNHHFEGSPNSFQENGINFVPKNALEKDSFHYSGGSQSQFVDFADIEIQDFALNKPGDDSNPNVIVQSSDNGCVFDPPIDIQALLNEESWYSDINLEDIQMDRQNLNNNKKMSFLSGTEIKQQKQLKSSNWIRGIVKWLNEVCLTYEDAFFKIFPIVAIAFAWWLCFM